MYKAIIKYKPIEVIIDRKSVFIENEPEEHKVVASTETQAIELLVAFFPKGFTILELIKL